MKKTLALIIAIFTVLFLVACKDKTNNTSDASNNTSNNSNSNNSNSNNSNSNSVQNNSHSHTYGEWVVVKQATCTENGKEERKCNCGTKESRDTSANGHHWNNATCTEASYCSKCQATNGDSLGHTTDNGICDRCGIEYYSPYQLALKELNDDYEKQKTGLISLEASISAKESILQGTLNRLGISYLSSKSYYNSQLNSIQSQLYTKYAQLANASSTSEKNRLEKEISQLNEQYKKNYQALQLCDSQTEINQLKSQYAQLKQSIENDYQQRLNEINNQYR